MAKFWLIKTDKSETFDLNTEKALAYAPKGFGNAFAVTYKEAADRKYATNVKPEFEQMKLSVIFNGDGSSGYANYKRLMDFFAGCEDTRLTLRYDDGLGVKYRDVILTEAPKSEISEEGVFSEDFTFDPQYFWYEEVEEYFSFRSTNANASTFPLGFPFGFTGKKLINRFEVKNEFYEKSSVVITISGKITNGINIKIESAATGEVIGEIAMSRGSTADTRIVIDATTKKVTVMENGKTTNGYDLIDHTKQSFLYLPYGRHVITANITPDDDGKIELSIKRYLLG